MKHIAWMLLSLVSLFFMSGCSTKEPTPLPTPVLITPPDDMPKRHEIVANALKHKDKRDGGDCSGFVSLVNQESGYPYFEPKELEEYFEDSRRSLAIYNLLESQHRLHTHAPKIGDLIFFANTTKKYAKKKESDNITHIGVVIKIDSDDTIHFLHNIRGKNSIGYMNEQYPQTPIASGKTLNSYLEKCPIHEGHHCLTPAYFSAYGTLL